MLANPFKPVSTYLLDIKHHLLTGSEIGRGLLLRHCAYARLADGFCCLHQKITLRDVDQLKIRVPMTSMIY